jgi:hypothetical protein
MSWAVLLCLVLMVGFGVAIPPAMRADRYDEYHLIHRNNCPDCEES